MTGAASDIDAVLLALGAHLRVIREERGLTPKQAVELLRETVGESIVDRTLLSYEYATRGLTVRRLLELAKTYGVPATAILTDAIRRAEQDPACPLCGRH